MEQNTLCSNELRGVTCPSSPAGKISLSHFRLTPALDRADKVSSRDSADRQELGHTPELWVCLLVSSALVFSAICEDVTSQGMNGAFCGDQGVGWCSAA